MGMISFFINLTVIEVIMINFTLFLLNLLFIFLIRGLVKGKYEKTKSVEQTLYFQMKLGRYAQVFPIILTSFISSLTITPKLKALGRIGGFLSVMAIVFSMIILIAVIQQLVMHNINKALRDTTATKGEEVKNLTRILLFTVLPTILFFLIIFLLDEKMNLSKELENIIKPMIIGAAYLIFSLAAPFFTKYMIKAVPMEEGEVKRELKDFANKAGFDKINIYLWPTKKNKVANALVTGLIRKDIFISDYLLENLTLQEIKSILAHEIGHIKKKHLWIRTALFLGMIVIFPSMGALFEWYEARNSEIPIWLGLTIMAIVFIAYVGFFIYFIYRVQERQADAYVLDIGVDGLVFVRALYKLNNLNNQVMKFGKLDEKLQTHPSMAKRINWIMEKSSISYESIEELIN